MYVGARSLLRGSEAPARPRQAHPAAPQPALRKRRRPSPPHPERARGWKAAEFGPQKAGKSREEFGPQKAEKSRARRRPRNRGPNSARRRPRNRGQPSSFALNDRRPTSGPGPASGVQSPLHSPPAAAAAARGSRFAAAAPFPPGSSKGCAFPSRSKWMLRLSLAAL